MNTKTLENWKERGYLLDEILLEGPGEVVNTGGNPYYIGEAKEAGYLGNAHPLIVSRYAMGTRLGRPLTRNELVRFRGSDKRDFRLSNLRFFSGTASSSELFRANLEPVLGYSHCLCGCLTELDLEKQTIKPYCYAPGHRPKSKGDQANPKRARPPRAKILIEKLTQKEEMPNTPLSKGSIEMREEQKPVDSLEEYRALFEKMIRNLSWEEA